MTVLIDVTACATVNTEDVVLFQTLLSAAEDFIK